MKIVECVSNFSEGRRREVIDEMAKAIRKAGVEILDVESNEIHNECVITFIGGLNEIAEAAFLGAKKAAELIDLNKHEGEHPYIGACDAITFIPITATIEDCKAVAEETGKRIASELGIPVYFYEANARSEERKRLENIRKSNYEWLKEHFDERPADIGDKIHPTAGATFVGASNGTSVTYNVYLDKPSDAMGKEIAKAVKGRGAWEAIGFVNGERTQISMKFHINFVDVPLEAIDNMHKALEFIKDEAERYGAVVDGGEIVGLIPKDAMITCIMDYLQLNEFNSDTFLEGRLERLFAMQRLDDFTSALAGVNFVGGGSAAAVVGAVSCALAERACALSNLVEEEEKLKALRDRFFGLAQKDSTAFKQFMDAREEKTQEALKYATLVLLETYNACKEALGIEEKVLELWEESAPSDIERAIANIKCAIVRSAIELAKSAQHNIEIYLDLDFIEEIKSEISKETQDD